MDKPRTQEQKEKSNQNVLKKQDARKNKIKEKGIDYDFEGHVSGSPPDRESQTADER